MSRTLNTGKKITTEKETVSKMIYIYCKHKHQTAGELCDECNNLQAYAFKRLSYCKFGEEKTTCEKCPVHCYKPDRKEQIKTVMRYVGPRMFFYHPRLAMNHLIKNIRS